MVMSLKPGEEIGNELHKKVDQFFRNLINASKTTKVKLYTIYSPPNHPDGTVHKTKAEADRAEAEEHH